MLIAIYMNMISETIFDTKRRNGNFLLTYLASLDVTIAPNKHPQTPHF
jgi:hypothetical protein